MSFHIEKTIKQLEAERDKRKRDIEIIQEVIEYLKQLFPASTPQTSPAQQTEKPTKKRKWNFNRIKSKYKGLSFKKGLWAVNYYNRKICFANFSIKN